MAKKRRHSRNPSKRRSSRRKKTVVIRVKTNPSRKRHYRRNAPKKRRHSKRRSASFSMGGLLPSKASLFDAVYVTGGFIGTKIAANTVLPMIGINQPVVRVGVKAVLAGVIGWAGSRVLGKSAGQYLMIGGLVEAVNDAVQTYVTPYVPALAVSAYPGLESYVDMGAYADLSGMVSDDVMEQV